MTNGELQHKAAEIRLLILNSIVSAGKGHIGGALSCTDILVALYHGGVLRVDPSCPDLESRDRFILSKGHSGIALYAVLADMGFFDVSELSTVCRNGSRLGEHPDHRVPGVETDTGSLGHGLGIAAGIALASKMDGADRLAVALLGDGECYEGSIWEACMFASHHELRNLVAVVDRNRQITLDYTEQCLRLEPFVDKWAAFGWDVAEVDGHSFEELRGVFTELRKRKSNRPLVVIANTVKGKGISFMEGQLKWHHGMPTDDEVRVACCELKSALRGK